MTPTLSKQLMVVLKARGGGRGGKLQVCFNIDFILYNVTFRFCDFFQFFYSRLVLQGRALADGNVGLLAVDIATAVTLLTENIPGIHE